MTDVNAKAGKKKTQMYMRNRKKLIFYICFMAWPVLQFAVFYIGVNFNSLLLAFQNIDAMKNETTWTFTGNFAYWFKDPNNVLLLKNALKVSVISYAVMLLSVPLGLFFSYYIFKRLPMSMFFRFMLFLPSIISSIVLVSIYKYFTEYAIPEFVYRIFHVEMESMLLANLKTRYWTVMFYNLFVSFGTSVLLYSNKMMTIPPELIEAAQLDGASAWKEFVHVVFPHVYPTMMVFLISGIAGIFINQINAFSFFGDVATSDVQTLGYLMYVRTYHSRRNMSQLPPLAALSLIMTAVAIVLTFTVRYVLNKVGPKED